MLLLLAAGASPLAAQSTTGNIQGVVLEQAGGPLAGVAITVTHMGRGMVRDTRTDRSGRFAVTGLQPGTYEVMAALDGFASQRQERIHLAIGQTVVSRLELRRAPMPDTLTLAPGPSVLEPRRAGVGTRIERTEIEHLPLADRRVLDLAMLAPGVASGPATGVVSAGGIDGTGGPSIVDGLDRAPTGRPARPPATSGLTPYLFGRGMIRDALVLVGAPPASFGRTDGPVVSLVTTAGSGTLSGRVFHLLRDDGLSANTRANDALGRPTPEMHANQFGGSFGGPLAPGHAFYASYDGLRERQENPVLPDVAGDAAASGLDPFASSWTRTTDQDVLFVRTDHRLGPAGDLVLSYHQLDLSGAGLVAGGPTQSEGSTGPADVGMRAATATARRSVGRAAVHEVRARYLHGTEALRPASRAPQADIRDTGALALRVGGSHAAPSDTTRHRVQVADTLMWAAGGHAVVAGGDLEIDDWRHVSSANALGTYVFGSPAGFASRRPDAPGETYSQAFFESGREAFEVRPDTRALGLFARHAWVLGDALSLDTGLRYDFEHVAAPAATNPHPELRAAGIDTGALTAGGGAWDPRLGVAWAPSDGHVVRTAYGIVHGRLPLAMAGAAHAYNGIVVRTTTLEGASGDPVPTYPDRLDAPPPSGRPSILFVDPGFRRARYAQFSAAYEWQWMPTTSIGVVYLHTRGAHLPRPVDVNVGERALRTFTIAGEDGTVSAPVYGPGPFTSFARVVRVESTAESRYTGLAFELRRRSEQGLQYRITYTLSRATDTAPSTSPVFPEGPDTRGAVASGSEAATHPAPGDHDRRHQLVMSSVFLTDIFVTGLDTPLERVLGGWRVGAILRLVSGRPYSAYVDADIDGDLNGWGDRAPGTSRNAFRTPRAGRLDVRISRDLPLPGGLALTASADIFNVLNAAHYRDVDATQYAASGTTLVRNPQFGERLDQLGPRVVQLGLMVTF